MFISPSICMYDVVLVMSPCIETSHLYIEGESMAQNEGWTSD